MLQNDMAKIIDTNILTAYLLGKQPQSQKIAKLLRDNKTDLVLTDLAIAELVWVLASYYKLNKTQIVEIVESVLNLEITITNLNLCQTALAYFKKYNIDYVDAYHAALVHVNKLEGIFSYDKDFDKIPNTNRLIP
jgi:predicted nucleic acid-binding protein